MLRARQLGQAGARGAVALALLLILGFAAYLVWTHLAPPAIAVTRHS
jgi:hypothetical protein